MPEKRKSARSVVLMVAVIFPVYNALNIIKYGFTGKK